MNISDSEILDLCVQVFFLLSRFKELCHLAVNVFRFVLCVNDSLLPSTVYKLEILPSSKAQNMDILVPQVHDRNVHHGLLHPTNTM